MTNIGYNGNVTEIYGTRDNVYRFEEKNDQFNDQKIYPNANRSNVTNKEVEEFVKRQINTPEDLNKFIEVANRKLNPRN